MKTKVAKYLRNETLRLVSKGVQSKSVVIFNYFGPLTLGHSFQCPPKVLKNELLLAVGNVIVIAEPAFFEEQEKGLFGQMVSKNWQFLFANIAIGVFAQYFYRLAIGYAFFDVKTHDRVLRLAE